MKKRPEIEISVSHYVFKDSGRQPLTILRRDTATKSRILINGVSPE